MNHFTQWGDDCAPAGSKYIPLFFSEDKSWLEWHRLWLGLWWLQKEVSDVRGWQGDRGGWMLHWWGTKHWGGERGGSEHMCVRLSVRETKRQSLCDIASMGETSKTWIWTKEHMRERGVRGGNKRERNREGKVWKPELETASEGNWDKKSWYWEMFSQV